MKLPFCILFIVLLFLSEKSVASHISGGELFYEYLGPGTLPNTDHYRITVRLFRECNSNGQNLNTEFIDIGIFSTASNTFVTGLILNKLWADDPPVIQNNPGAIPCLTGDGSLCYQIGLFNNTIDLPRTPDGYTLSWVRCCRQQVTNVFNNPYPDSAQGATFITHIPGTNILRNGINNSPQFVVKDTVLVCADHPFKLDFSAFDVDGDSLAYTFCDAYLGGTPSVPDPPPADVLSLTALPYLKPYSGAYPLGKNVTIDAETGIISGKAPATPGKYVVNVCVEEYRNGVLLNIHHKDFILKIANCDFASAQLKPSYLTCDGFGLQFENNSNSAQIYSYFWDFGVPGVMADTSAQARPYFNFPDSGIYVVKLVVNRGGACGDSTTTLAKIYPGFTTNFGFAVKCLPEGTVFTDSSTTKYGQIDSWQWDFGDGAGTSTMQNPVYQYLDSGLRNVKLISTNSKGCTDSITKQLSVPVRLIVTLNSKDTSLCNLDTLQILAKANAKSKFSWLPNTAIVNPNTASPLVFPQTAITYTVIAVDSSGCRDTASVSVKILPLPSVSTIPNTVICSGTGISLTTTSTGNTYRWQPGAGLSDSTAISPVAQPVANTQYIVTARAINGCTAKDTVDIAVNISPTVNASADSLICVDGSAHMYATSPDNVSYNWYPATGLDNPSTQSPVASPTITTSYKVEATDSNGCKGRDTVVISVMPRPAFAVTPAFKEICRGDSLLLTASGGSIYRWYPATSIYNDTTAATSVYPATNTTYTVVITSTACNVTDSVKAKVFVSEPFALSITKSNDVDCFVAQAKLQATGGTQYTWTPGGTLNTTHSANPVAMPLETTTYYVTAGNGTACIEKDSIQVKIITDNVQNGYYMPTAFTPNGDNVNDCFRVKDWGGIKSIRLSIYNRWGQLIFYSTDPSGCWDGTYEGKPQPPGTYVYQVWANTICGNVYRKGTLVLIR